MNFNGYTPNHAEITGIRYGVTDVGAFSASLKLIRVGV